MEQKRKRHSPEFKNDALAMLESGRSVKDVAKGLGISAGMLNRWKREKSQEIGGRKAFTGNGIPRDEELARLRKENADLKETNEILKKAMAIFTVKPRR